MRKAQFRLLFNDHCINLFIFVQPVNLHMYLADWIKTCTMGPKTVKKDTNSTQNKSETHRAKQYEVTSFLSTDCELSTETCSKNVYSLGPWLVVERTAPNSKRRLEDYCLLTSICWELASRTQIEGHGTARTQHCLEHCLKIGEEVHFRALQFYEINTAREQDTPVSVFVPSINNTHCLRPAILFQESAMRRQPYPPT